MDIFESTEGIDISPAAGVAVAALRQAASAAVVKKNDAILLNITGGGEKRFRKENRTYQIEPRIISKKISEKEIGELLCHTLKRS